MRVYKQHFQPTCGPKCLQTIFGYYDKYPDFTDILDVCETDSVGTPLRNISIAAKCFGFNTIEYKNKEATIKNIKKHTDMGEFVIIHWYTGDGRVYGSHLAIVYRVDKKYLHLIDTSTHLYVEPYVFMKRSMLNKCWKHHPETRWALVVKP